MVAGDLMATESEGSSRALYVKNTIPYVSSPRRSPRHQTSAPVTQAVNPRSIVSLCWNQDADDPKDAVPTTSQHSGRVFNTPRRVETARRNLLSKAKSHSKFSIQVWFISVQHLPVAHHLVAVHPLLAVHFLSCNCMLYYTVLVPWQQFIIYQLSFLIFASHRSCPRFEQLWRRNCIAATSITRPWWYSGIQPGQVSIYCNCIPILVAFVLTEWRVSYPIRNSLNTDSKKSRCLSVRCTADKNRIPSYTYKVILTYSTLIGRSTGVL